MLARLIAVSMLCTATLCSAATARQASPQAVACHDYATRKYIDDFRQAGPRRVDYDGRGLNVVMAFQNENPKYEHYFAACMKQDESGKVR